MVSFPHRTAISNRSRHGWTVVRRRHAGRYVAVFIVLAAACSPDDVELIDPAPTEAVTTSIAGEESSSGTVIDRPATQARAILADGGAFPVSEAQRNSALLPDAVAIGGGRVWVPWPPYPETDEGAVESVVGSQSALLADIEQGARYIAAQRAQWEAEQPPYTEAARAAFAGRSRVATRRAGTDTAWELIIDSSGLESETRISADRSGAYDHVRLCPPHPTAENLGIDTGESSAERSRAAAVIEAFIVGMRSPGGRPMHSWGTTRNDVAKLLVYSPGEPMELALGGHSLADRGFFPGDWSELAKQWLTRRAAQGAVTDTLVGHAVVSPGPQSLWQACSDLATIVPGIYTESHRTKQLESLWARGLRLQFTSAPVERAWVADLSAAGHALALVCHSSGQSRLVDASSGEVLDAPKHQPAQVEAMWLTWSRLSFRVQRNALFEGDCDGDAFEAAAAWLRSAKEDHAAEVDWTEPRAWGSGVRNQWVAVREWIDVTQAEAWQAHRDHAWHLAFWCEIGIPLGQLNEGELQRRELAAHCTPEQWAAMSETARDAPPMASELSATNWEADTSWYERMYLSPFKSLKDILGCPPDESLIAESLQRPIERRVKRPWPPGSLDSASGERAYPRPVPPCPQAGWPPQSDRYWWPMAGPIAGAHR